MLPDDFSNKETAGKPAEFNVTIDEVREKRLPEITDEFAAKVSEHSTADEFLTQTRVKLETQSTEKYDGEVRNALITALINATEIEVQPVLVQREVTQLITEFESNVKRIGYTLEQYLKTIDGSIEKLRENYLETAEKRVKADLILAATADQEKIEASEDDLRNEIMGWNEPELSTDSQVTSYLRSIDQERLKYSIRREKTLDFLVAHAVINN